MRATVTPRSRVSNAPDSNLADEPKSLERQFESEKLMQRQAIAAGWGGFISVLSQLPQPLATRVDRAQNLAGCGR